MMKYENFDDSFETYINTEGHFVISISYESDISTDGGMSFEEVTNESSVSVDNAKKLICELQAYIDNKKKA
jgi:hypothetical protein